MQQTIETSDSSMENLGEVLLQEHDGLASLVQLLKDEQQCILQRNPEPLVGTISKIEAQLEKVRQAQTLRDEILGKSVSPESAEKPQKLSDRVAALSSDATQYPLIVAQRIDVLLALVHELTWQNHILLSHSLHFLQEFLAPWLDPKGEAITYYRQDGMIHKTHGKSGAFYAVA